MRLANIQDNLQLPLWDLQESWTSAARLQRRVGKVFAVGIDPGSGVAPRHSGRLDSVQQ